MKIATNVMVCYCNLYLSLQKHCYSLIFSNFVCCSPLTMMWCKVALSMKFIYNKAPIKEDAISVKKPTFWQFQQEHHGNLCISGHMTGAADLAIFFFNLKCCSVQVDFLQTCLSFRTLSSPLMTVSARTFRQPMYFWSYDRSYWFSYLLF